MGLIEYQGLGGSEQAYKGQKDILDPVREVREGFFEKKAFQATGACI